MPLQPQKKILVVDDAVTTQKWAQFVLEKAGFEVNTTDNPVMVPSMIFKEGYDLVLLDVSMPLLDGNRVAAIMRGSGVTTAIYLYSSKSNEELQQLVSECGADGYVQKSSDPRAFVQEVTAILQTHGGKGERKG